MSNKKNKKNGKSGLFKEWRIGLLLISLMLNGVIVTHYRNPTVATQIMLEAHKEWLDSYGVRGERADLSNADLSTANLFGAHLSHANLSNADLSTANLFGAHLSHAYLYKADLSYANLSSAYLSEADLSNADLSNVSGINVCSKGCKK